MSEKPPAPPSQEKQQFKDKHKGWFRTAREELGALTIGGIGGSIGLSILAGLGLAAYPAALLVGTIAATIAAYKFTKNTTKANA